MIRRMDTKWYVNKKLFVLVYVYVSVSINTVHETLWLGVNPSTAC